MSEAINPLSELLYDRVQDLMDANDASLGTASHVEKADKKDEVLGVGNAELVRTPGGEVMLTIRTSGEPDKPETATLTHLRLGANRAVEEASIVAEGREVEITDSRLPGFLGALLRSLEDEADSDPTILT